MSKYLNAVLEVLNTQTGQLTDRQIHYRLVAKGFYANTKSSYNHLTKVLKDGRIDGLIPWDRIVDSSKPMFLQAEEEREDATAERKFEYEKHKYDSAEQTFRGTRFYTGLWTFQPEYVEVWVEKDALARILKEITDKWMVSLIICKGYQSITNEKNRRDYYESLVCHDRRITSSGNIISERKLTILYFGDYDPRGENIPQVIVRDFSRLDYEATLEKVALTQEQIEAYHLISAPCKKTDTMAKEWMSNHGDVAYELDALEPNVLRQLVETNITAHFSQEKYAERNEYMKQESEKLERKITEYLDAS